MGLKQQSINFFISRRVWEAVKHEKEFFFKRLACFSPSNLLRLFQLRKTQSLKLILGSGPHQKENWCSLDLSPPPGGLRWDLRWSIPLKAQSVTAIHCEHFLEHLFYPLEAKKFLAQCYRVLKPSGTLRLIVPDGEKYIRAYSQGDKAFFETLKDLGGGETAFRTPMEVINQSFRMGGDHLFAYDRKTLSLLLHECGFEFFEDLTNASNTLDLPESWRKVESLYLNLRKTKHSPKS